MICIRHQDFWERGSRGDASLSQPFHAVCHLFRYLNREPSSREDTVTVWNMSIKLWTLFMLLPPYLITPPILRWARAPLSPKEPSPWGYHPFISLSTATPDLYNFLQWAPAADRAAAPRQEQGDVFWEGAGTVWVPGDSSWDSSSVSPWPPG